nr:hypothetical protein [uncultured Prevotella sp.]
MEQNFVNYPPLEDLKQLSEEEVRAWFGKVNTYRDEAIMQIRTKCDKDVFNVRTEQQVERNRIICLIDLKRSQLPSGGTPDEREKAFTTSIIRCNSMTSIRRRKSMTSNTRRKWPSTHCNVSGKQQQVSSNKH